jgi:hypothetical protein
MSRSTQRRFDRAHLQAYGLRVARDIDIIASDNAVAAAGGEARARSHCQFVARLLHPLYTRSTTIIGVSSSEATMQPDPRRGEPRTVDGRRPGQRHGQPQRLLLARRAEQPAMGGAVSSFSCRPPPPSSPPSLLTPLKFTPPPLPPGLFGWYGGLWNIPPLVCLISMEASGIYNTGRCAWK